MYDIIVIGGGPAGMTAAMYAARAGKRVILFEGEAFGGQISKSRMVENYPGVPNISGMDLSDGLYSQLTNLGVETKMAVISSAEKTDGGFSVSDGIDTYRAKCLILCTGVSHRTLGVPGEEKFVGSGISFCAVCDGAFFRKKEVAVIGGGSTALSDALYLSEICQKVYLIHRREGFRAEETLVKEASARENIVFLLNRTVAAFEGEFALKKLILEDTKTGERTELPVSGAFEAVGLIPQNQPFASLCPLDESGYFDIGEDCRTPVEGVFVAGDCRRKSVRQLTTAVSDGTVAALAAIEYLNS